MPQYFFHLHNGRTKLDATGIELPNLETARTEAVLTCGEMLRELPPAVLEGEPWCLWVTDQPNDGGAGLFSVTVVMRNSRPN